jgi:hypothetical protein
MRDFDACPFHARARIAENSGREAGEGRRVGDVRFEVVPAAERSVAAAGQASDCHPTGQGQAKSPRVSCVSSGGLRRLVPCFDNGRLVLSRAPK